MKEYKEKLKVTRVIYVIAAVIMIAFSILALLSESGVISISPAAGDSHWQSMWRGMVFGASFVMAILMVAWTIRISKALRSQEELKKLYVEVNDERKNQIYTSARALSMQVFLIFGLVAGIVAGYFNMTVSVTILSCMMIHSIIGIVCKLYYSRKY